MSKETGPGLFYILSRPKAKYEDDYHEWYNSEHGPLRLSTDFIRNGLRYRTVDLSPPVFLATYDYSRLEGFDERQYTKLRDNRSPREREVLDNKIDLLDRRFFKNLSTRGSSSDPAPVMMSVIFVVKDEHVEEMHRWYEEVSVTLHSLRRLLIPCRSTPMTSPRFLAGEGAAVFN